MMHVAAEVIAGRRRENHLRRGFAVVARKRVAAALQILVTGLEPLCRPIAITAMVEAVATCDDTVELGKLEPELDGAAVWKVVNVAQGGYGTLRLPHGVDAGVAILDQTPIGQGLSKLVHLLHRAQLNL